jgi:hypothetical protein
MNGPLGVCKINKDTLPESELVTESFDLTQRKIAVSWDNTELEAVFGKSGGRSLWEYSEYGEAATKETESDPDSVDVFFLAVRLMGTNYDNEHLESQYASVMGLLLLPTQDKGHFRRVGHFELAVTYSEDRAAVAAVFAEPLTVIGERFYIAKDEIGFVTIAIV